MTDQFNNQNGYGQPGQPIPPAQGYQQPGYQHSYTQPVVDAQNPRKPLPAARSARPSRVRRLPASSRSAASPCIRT
mgnify:CR=1 FL=1